MFFRAMVRIFSFGERWNVPFNSAVASLNGTFHLSPHENILTIALINIHYLYTSSASLQHAYNENHTKKQNIESSSFNAPYRLQFGKSFLRHLCGKQPNSPPSCCP